GGGRTTELGRVVAVDLRAGLADLQDEFSVLREFQHLPVILAVAADPDESLRVDIDAVLVLEPVVALSRAAPGLEQIALLIELEHRGRRLAAFRTRWIEARC